MSYEDNCNSIYLSHVVTRKQNDILRARFFKSLRVLVNLFSVLF